MVLTKNDLQNIGNVLDNKLIPVKKDIKKIKENISAMLDFLDNENIRLSKKVSRIEDHLGLPTIH